MTCKISQKPWSEEGGKLVNIEGLSWLNEDKDEICYLAKLENSNNYSLLTWRLNRVKEPLAPDPLKKDLLVKKHFNRESRGSEFTIAHIHSVRQ